MDQCSCFSEKVENHSSNIVTLLLRYIDTSGQDDFAAIAKCLSSYTVLSEEHRLRYPTWLWEKRKLQWVFSRLSDVFPGHEMHTSQAERYAVNLAYMLSNTFRIDMHNEDNPQGGITVLFDDSLQQITADSEKDEVDISQAPEETDSFRDEEDDIESRTEYPFLRRSEIRSEAEKEALERLTRIIRELPVLYRIAIYLVDVYPDLGMPEDQETRNYIERLAGVSLDEVEQKLEVAVDSKWKPRTYHRYRIKVSDVAGILNTSENTFSQWLSRGRRLLKNKYAEATHA